MTPTPKPDASRHPLQNRRAFRNRIDAWFSDNAEDYPWRRTEDPYAVLVSELMLQQTQVATVLNRGYFTRWMRLFPDVETLADAEEDKVLRAWEGLGYYSRARNLRKAALHIVEHFGGAFPETVAEIESLPGVGRYTAGAVASFAFDQPAAAVDANIARVLARLFDFSTEITSSAGQEQLWQWAAELVPPGGGRLFNSGLMELGQKLCLARSTDCPTCPVADFCTTRHPLTLPKKKAARKTVVMEEHSVWILRNERVLLEQEQGSRRKGLWKLPNRINREIEDLPVILKSKYGITHHRITLLVHDGSALPKKPLKKNEAWTPLAQLDDVAMQSPHRRALNALLQPQGEDMLL